MRQKVVEGIRVECMRIEFTKTISAEDFVATMKFNMRRVRFISYSVFAVCALVCFQVEYDYSAWTALFVLLFLALTWEILYPLFWFPAKYRKSRLDGEEIRVLIDDEGMATAGRDVQSKANWDAYHRYAQTPNLILLYTSSACIITPKRCMLPEQLEQFQAFLKQRLA